MNETVNINSDSDNSVNTQTHYSASQTLPSDEMPSDYRITDNVSFGYRINPDQPQELLIDEDAAPYVHFLFDEFLRGAQADEIARRLTNIGAPSPSMYKTEKGYQFFQNRNTDFWVPGNVKKILQNQIYTGALSCIRRRRIRMNEEFAARGKSLYKDLPMQETKAIIPNHHPAYITPEEFQHIQVRLKGGKMTSRGSDALSENSSALSQEELSLIKSLFKGRIYCGQCQRPMFHYRSRSTEQAPYSYYVCSSHIHHLPDACGPTHYRTDDIYPKVLEALYAERKEAIQIAESLNQGLSSPDYLRAEKLLTTEINSIVSLLYKQKSGMDSDKQSFSDASSEIVLSEDQLNKRLNILLEERKELAFAYTKKNRWVTLFSQMPDSLVLSKDSALKYVHRVEIHSDGSISMQPRETDHKEHILHWINYSLPN